MTDLATIVGTVSVALGLLLAFRVNTAYDRYWEGRKLIQTVMATIRNLSRQVWINIPEETETDHLEKMRCVKLLLAFMVATKHHLRHEYGIDYYDLEVLLPPNWKPASVTYARKPKMVGKKSLSQISIQNKAQRLMDRAKSIKLVVSLHDSIKPPTHECPLDSDDPTDMCNVRRSLLRQHFPDSDLADVSTAAVRRKATGTESDEEDVDDEATENGDEEAQEVPETCDAAAPEDCEAGPRPRGLNISGSLPEEQSGRHHLHLPHRRHHKKANRTFTSDEDLPDQGDSDLALPIEILFRIALYINQAKAAGKIESNFVSVTTASIDTLVNCLTAFERIVHTPIPKAYNIHLKQGVVLYIFFFPFALVESIGWLVAPMVALVSFTLFGIEAIGAEIENPFGYDANDLPLNRYCDELKKEVEYIIYRIPTHSTSILLDGQ
ncbi:hypothetical protein DFQ28_005140 [Apophysomyces sp. BC1034]|nr:hypothetical protein DFQ30_000909 [Apophysomyces sp. BC1015]KAG0180246.1 hypothetical protein DFQ29_000980 [Apophysomyces sp. BC1021]KAG0188283.1 hypothetical protein DFQ28_005140 [Apophysomyces sp. BC1034]